MNTNQNKVKQKREIKKKLKQCEEESDRQYREQNEEVETESYLVDIVEQAIKRMTKKVSLPHEYEIEALLHLTTPLKKKYYNILLNLVRKNDARITNQYTEFLAKRDSLFRTMTVDDWEKKIESLPPDPSVNKRKHKDSISKWAIDTRKLDSMYEIAEEACDIVSNIDIDRAFSSPRSPESPKYRDDMLNSRKKNCSPYYDELNSIGPGKLLSYSDDSDE